MLGVLLAFETSVAAFLGRRKIFHLADQFNSFEKSQLINTNFKHSSIPFNTRDLIPSHRISGNFRTIQYPANSNPSVVSTSQLFPLLRIGHRGGLYVGYYSD